MSPIKRYKQQMYLMSQWIIMILIGFCKTLDCWKVEMLCTGSRNLCSGVKKKNRQTVFGLEVKLENLFYTHIFLSLILRSAE